MWKIGQKQDFLNLLKNLNECLYYLLYSCTNWAKILSANQIAVFLNPAISLERIDEINLPLNADRNS